MKTFYRSSVLSMGLVSALILASCDEEDPDHIVRNEDGGKCNILGLWNNADSTTGATTGDYCHIGDIGVSCWFGGQLVGFSYDLVDSYRLDGGAWINSMDLECDESEVAMFDVGTTYHASMFVWNDNDHFNLVIGTSLPYPTTGNDYPSTEFPLFRHFAR